MGVEREQRKTRLKEKFFFVRGWTLFSEVCICFLLRSQLPRFAFFQSNLPLMLANYNILRSCAI